MKAHRQGVAAAAASVLAVSSLALGLDFEAPPEQVLSTELDNGYSYNLALAGGDTWIAVWHTTDSLGDTVGSDQDLVMVRASDGAAAWSSPVPLNPDAASDPSSQADIQPAIATDGSGNWVVAWRSLSGSTEQLKTLRSTDDGLTWDSPRVVATGVDAWSIRIETDRSGLWIVTWHSNESVTTPTGPSGTDGDIFAARSTDGGGTWSAPELVNSDAVGDEHGDFVPAIATDRQGTWMIAWSAYLYSGFTYQHTTVRVATSTDGGQTWGPPVTPFDPPTPPVEYQGPESWRPALATDGCGNWILFSGSNRSEDDHVGGPSGLLGMRSFDAGQSWLGYWRIYPVPPPYPPDHWRGGEPSLATDRSGAWRLVWRGDGISWSGTQGSGGGQWGDPESLGPRNTWDGPVVATNEQGRWRVLWTHAQPLVGAELHLYNRRAQVPLGQPCTAPGSPGRTCLRFVWVRTPSGRMVLRRRRARCAPHRTCIDCSIGRNRRRLPSPFAHQILQRWERSVAHVREAKDLDQTLAPIRALLEKAPLGAQFSEERRSTLSAELAAATRQGSLEDADRVVVGAANALELDRRLPPLRSHAVSTGKRVRVDLDGVAELTFHHVRKPGTVSLVVEEQRSEGVDGHELGWPAAVFRFEFTGALAPDGFVEVGLHSGGFSFERPPTQTRLFEWDGRRYRNMTTGWDPEHRMIRGNTRRLSAYVVAQREPESLLEEFVRPSWWQRWFRIR